MLELALPGYVDLWVKQFKQLGNNVETNVVPFSTIISKINALQYGNSAKPGGGANIYTGSRPMSQAPAHPRQLPEPARLGPGPRSMVPRMLRTSRITAAMAEPNVEKRKQLSMDFQRNVVKAGGQGLITTFISFNNALTWNYPSGPNSRRSLHVAPGQSGVARCEGSDILSGRPSGRRRRRATGAARTRGGLATSRPLSLCVRAGVLYEVGWAMVSVWAAHFQLLPSRTQTEVSKAWRGLGLPALLDLLVDFIGHCTTSLLIGRTPRRSSMVKERTRHSSDDIISLNLPGR